MQNKVQIIPDELGNVIRVSNNNEEFGYIRLTQEKVSFGNTGWVNRKQLSTLLHGKVEDLREMGIQNMKELPGKIVVRESLEPFSSVNPDRDLKIAGQTGIICCQDGQPIYRKTMYVADVNAEDTLVAHNNGDAIREANGTESKLAAFTKPEVTNVTPNQAFDVETEAEEVVAEDTKQVDLEDSISEVKAEAELEVEDSTFEL
jgi:hypothetical protein